MILINSTLAFAINFSFNPNIGIIGESTLVILDQIPSKIKNLYADVLGQEIKVENQQFSFSIPSDTKEGVYIITLFQKVFDVFPNNVYNKVLSVGFSKVYVNSRPYLIMKKRDMSYVSAVVEGKLISRYEISDILNNKLGKPKSGSYYKVKGGDESYVAYPIEYAKKVLERWRNYELTGFYREEYEKFMKKKMDFVYGSEEYSLFAFTALRNSMPGILCFIAFGTPPWTHGIYHSFILIIDINKNVWVFDPVGFFNGEVVPYSKEMGDLNIELLYLN